MGDDIIFDAYLYDNSGIAIHSIKATADFVLKTKWTVMIYMDIWMEITALVAPQ